MSETKQELMLRISKEGHSFPHYNTCKTCEEDFDEVTKFVAKEIFAELEEVVETREFVTGGIELAIDKSDFDLIKSKFISVPPGDEK